jgi:hypothetical protein
LILAPNGNSIIIAVREKGSGDPAVSGNHQKRKEKR